MFIGVCRFVFGYYGARLQWYLLGVQLILVGHLYVSNK